MIWVQRLRRLLYWLLPIVILVLVFSRIDPAVLLDHVRHANPGLLFAGLLLFPLFMLLGGLRWNVASRRYCHAFVPLAFSIRHYWIGQTLGLLVPGSIGWDAYRAVVAGKYHGQYRMNALVILVEKGAALFACVTLISLLAPLVPVRAGLHEIISWSHFLGLALAGLLAIFLSRRWHFFPRTFAAAIEPLRSPRLLLELLLLSLAILGTSAGVNQLLFQALGLPMPFLLNLFLAPVIYFLLALPISVAGIGVREASYIGLYGLFGVPTETALLVGFLVFCGDLCNTLLGAILLWGGRSEVIEINS